MPLHSVEAVDDCCVELSVGVGTVVVDSLQ